MKNNKSDISPLVYKDIDRGTPLKIVFLSGLGLEIRRQREGFLRRFALTHNVSYLALDYTEYIMRSPELSEERMKNAFAKTKDILEQTKEEKMILIGVCFGGLMALKIAEHMPKKIVGSILFSPAYETPNFPMINVAEELLQKRIKTLKDRRASIQILDKLITFKEMVISAFKTHTDKTIPSHYRGHLSIFHGSDDNLIPVENSRHIQKSLKNPHCHLHVIKKAGHSINTDFEMKRPLRLLKGYLERENSAL